MKQLLHTSGPHVVAALNDRAYAVVKPEDSGQCPAGAIAVELVPPAKGNAAGDASGDNPVQAVASTVSEDGQYMLCAVSRQDKTLALYSVALTAEGAGKVAHVEHAAVYTLSKRAGTLTFARVPGIDKETKSSIDIVIAGDLEGNATAYPVPCFKGNGEDPPNVSRLLLGHTASILTGVKVIEGNDGKMKIITSDRDEKVRVSSFPQTYIVEGYLLGHTAFVSCLDVATDKECTRCVTCSGDGTIRLWDYTSSVLEAIINSSDDGPQDNAEDEGDESDGKQDDVAVPIGVAMSPDGTTIAVVRDGINAIDVHKVSGSSQVSVEKCQTIQCPNQPLAVNILAEGTLCVLAKEPLFLLQYKAERDEAGVIASFSSMTEESAVCTCLREVGVQNDVSMPSTILETDQRGQLKLKKSKEGTIEKNEPWNNIERKEKDRRRVARRKKRKREAKAKEKKEAEVEA